MTEREWLTCDDPAPMIGHLIGPVRRRRLPTNTVRDRKLRLWVGACREAAGVTHFYYKVDHRTGLLDAARAWSSAPHQDCAAPVKAALLRDIFGNPFCPISIDPAWLTPTVVQLSQTAYEERQMPSGQLDPTRLSVLADALEDAGCDSQEMLSHLRSPGPHVRGCWCIDLLLGKE